MILVACAAIGLLTFLHLASEVFEGETMAFDRSILLGLRQADDLRIPIGPNWLLAAMTGVTALGGATVLTIMTAIVSGYLVVARRPATAMFVVASISGGAILTAILKHFFARMRPEIVPHLVAANSASFPSGHATNSAVTYLTLGVLLAKAKRRASVRAYLLGVASLMTIMVGCSRVYLGVHWPSDVVAGWCLGSVWALAVSVIAQFLQDRRSLESR